METGRQDAPLGNQRRMAAAQMSWQPEFVLVDEFDVLATELLSWQRASVSWWLGSMSWWARKRPGAARPWPPKGRQCHGLVGGTPEDLPLVERRMRTASLTPELLDALARLAPPRGRTSRTTSHAPQGTTSVVYHLHQDFKQPHRRVVKAPRFRAEITSYGNFVIGATLRLAANKTLELKGSLVAALRRCMRSRKAEIALAVRALAEH